MTGVEEKATFGILLGNRGYYHEVGPMNSEYLRYEVWKENNTKPLSSVRACEEAFIPTHVNGETLRIAYRDNTILGYYFADAELFCNPSQGDDGGGRARFVMNELFQKLYPDDDAVGAAWVRS